MQLRRAFYLRRREGKGIEVRRVDQEGTKRKQVTPQSWQAAATSALPEGKGRGKEVESGRGSSRGPKGSGF